MKKILALLLLLAFACVANAQSKPTLAKVKAAKIRLGFGKKSAVIDLENTDDVTNFKLNMDQKMLNCFTINI